MQVSTKNLVEEVIDLIQVPSGFTIHLDPDLPDMVCQRTKMIEVFSNLISNAAKYHDQETGNIRIFGLVKEATYEFCVEDDGPGIPVEYRDKVFEMFQTLQSRDTKESTGMGLAIVKKIIELER